MISQGPTATTGAGKRQQAVFCRVGARPTMGASPPAARRTPLNLSAGQKAVELSGPRPNATLHGVKAVRLYRARLQSARWVTRTCLLPTAVTPSARAQFRVLFHRCLLPSAKFLRTPDSADVVGIPDGRHPCEPQRTLCKPPLGTFLHDARRPPQTRCQRVLAARPFLPPTARRCISSRVRAFARP